jgi:hypothetical protein
VDQPPHNLDYSARPTKSFGDSPILAWILSAPVIVFWIVCIARAMRGGSMTIPAFSSAIGYAACFYAAMIGALGSLLFYARRPTRIRSGHIVLNLFLNITWILFAPLILIAFR